MDRYAVLVDPVATSLSPLIHARFAEQTGQALECSRIECPLDGFEAALRAFAATGGRGCSVAAPCGFDAAKLAARRSERAELAQAVDTLRFDAPEAGGWIGDHTGGIGLVRDIEVGAGVTLRQRRVLLVGAGAAGAGILGPLLAARPAEVVLANRTVGKAAAMVHRHLRWALRHGARLGAATLAAPGLGFDVVVNASSGSPQGAPAPVPAHVLAPGALAVDLRPGPAAEPFLAWARRHRAQPRDGLGALVEQAAEAFCFWRGVRPQTAPVLAELRRSLEAGA